jgi:hypothetical protein
MTNAEGSEAMHVSARFGAAVKTTAVALISASILAIMGIAAADPSSVTGKVVALSAVLKRCDFGAVNGVPPATKGTGYTIISRSASTVTAEVHLTGLTPDIWYGVRLIEAPRPGIGCSASDPGVGMGRLALRRLAPRQMSCADNRSSRNATPDAKPPSD